MTPKKLISDLSHRDDVEAAVAEVVAKILADYQAKTQFIDPTIPAGQLDNLDRDLAAVLLMALMTVFKNEATKVATQLELSTINIDGAARDWAWTQTKKIVQDFRAETLARLQREKAKGDAEKAVILAAIFNPFRSLGLASTHVTAAASAGELSQLRTFKAQPKIQTNDDGVLTQAPEPEVVTTWNTRKDIRVCPKCEPLNGQPEEVWSKTYYDGPPGHKNCRCFLTTEIK